MDAHEATEAAARAVTQMLAAAKAEPAPAPTKVTRWVKHIIVERDPVTKKITATRETVEPMEAPSPRVEAFLKQQPHLREALAEGRTSLKVLERLCR